MYKQIHVSYKTFEQHYSKLVTKKKFFNQQWPPYQSHKLSSKKRNSTPLSSWCEKKRMSVTCITHMCSGRHSLQKKIFVEFLGKQNVNNDPMRNLYFLPCSLMTLKHNNLHLVLIKSSFQVNIWKIVLFGTVEKDPDTWLIITARNTT